jgi:hypothetical protein
VTRGEALLATFGVAASCGPGVVVVGALVLPAIVLFTAIFVSPVFSSR